MLRMLKTRPSPALVISLIALFVSLGGAGYAAVTITGKQVKNSSLTGKDVKNSSLTGSDVKNSSLTGKDVKNRSLSGADLKDDGLGGTQILESQLGKVPSASTADSAGSADSVNGFRVRRIDFFKKPVSTAATEVLNFNGLKLEASCSAGGDLSVVATNTGATTAQIHAGQTQTGVANESEDDDFAANDTLEIATLSDTDATGILAYARSGGPAVTVTYLMEETGGCSFLGTATGG